MSFFVDNYAILLYNILHGGVGMDSKKVLMNIKNILNSTTVSEIDDETIKLFSKLSAFPIEKQEELFEQFLNNVDDYYNYIISFMKISDNKCDKDSHIYSSWYEKHSFDNYNGSSFKNRFWCRKCMQCSHVEFTYIKPEELSNLEEEKINKLVLVKSK